MPAPPTMPQSIIGTAPRSPLSASRMNATTAIRPKRTGTAPSPSNARRPSTARGRAIDTNSRRCCHRSLRSMRSTCTMVSGAMAGAPAD